MSAASYKADGNAAFAEKKYLKSTKLYTKAIELEKDDTALGALLSNRSAAYVFLQEYDKALNDANEAVRRRPNWSKAHVRVAESYARLQDFDRATMAYERAIELAEDEASKKRYQASLDTTKAAGARSMKPSHATDRKLYTAETVGEDHFTNNTLDDAYQEIMPNGAVKGGFSSLALPDIAECILLDETAFLIPAGKDPIKFPLAKKLELALQCELNYHECLKYFANAVWSPKDIVDDMEKRRLSEGQERVRRSCSILVRQQVISGFLLTTKGNPGSAVSCLKLALGIIEEGQKKWAQLPYDMKGVTFKPTYSRIVRTYLLNVLLRAARDAKSPSARRQWSLESVEKLAKEIIAENKVEAWPSALADPTGRTAYYRKPAWEAWSALGFVAGSRYHIPLHNLPNSKLVFADIKRAADAARFYDQAAEYMPDDWHDKSCVPIITKTKDSAQEFCMYQVDALKQTIAAMPAAQAASAPSELVKAVPTYRMKKGSSTAAIQRDGQWNDKPGSVIVVDALYV
ncbi:hypothetical protein JCM8097_008261 [Rhodosporidiobolus ruineniae]